MLGPGDYWNTLKRFFTEPIENDVCAYCGGDRAWDELPDGRRLCDKCYDGFIDTNARWADSWGDRRAWLEENAERD